MIVSISQPAYIPWLGYYDRINNSDCHVVLDNVQIERNTKTSFTNRNKIKTSHEPIWLSVPIKTRKENSNIINQVIIDNNINWHKKNFNSIKINYSKSRFFKNHEKWLNETYNIKWEKLILLINYFFEYLLKFLKIETEIIYSSDLKVSGHKSDYLLNICKHLGANNYISGPYGKDYLDEEKFQQNNIHIMYHKYKHPIYSQLGDKFEPNLSILDLIFNHGEDSLDILKSKIE